MFTKNLTPENRKQGEWLLGYYWRASVISRAPYYPITNWKGMLEFLDLHYPTYIEFLGEQLGSIPQDKMIQAMKDAAARGLTDYPRPAYFAGSIIGVTGVSSGAVIADTAAEIGGSIIAWSQAFTYVVIAGAIVYAGLLVYPYFKKARG